MAGRRDAVHLTYAVQAQRVLWFAAQMTEEEDKRADAVKALKDFVSTVVKTTGTSKTLEAFPIATVLLMIPWRSKLLVPNSIWP